METDLGKLFIGGISWDTNEDRLKEYFQVYGEVIEAMIMKDRTTNRARGFGFVVFSDPEVAERVVKEKHMIDGRTVEAKKAVPRDDHSIINRTNNSIQGSPNPGRTKKIFVGGLASTVNENDFKTYFEQFGNITDVVVMYDHNTQRPRGFGFITYDNEEAVERVLLKTFHELNGKMVEVKRAVPKDQSPGPTRSPLIGFNYGFGRATNFLNGYNLGSVGTYNMRMDGRFNPVGTGRAFGSPGYPGMNLDPGLSHGFNASNFGNNLGYSRVLNPYFNGPTNRYNTPIGYGTNRGESYITSPSRSVWGNVNGNGNGISGVNTSPGASSGSYFGGFGVFGNNAAGTWGSSPVSGQVAGSSSGFRGGENSYGLGSGGGLVRSNVMGPGSGSGSYSTNGGYEGGYGDIYHNGSVYGDSAWQSSTSEIGGSGSFGYGLGNGNEGPPKDSEGYVGGYTIANRQSNRGIAA